MTVSTTFRHIEATDALKKYADDKVHRLQKFLRQPMTAKVTLSHEKLLNSVEIQVQSGGEWYEAKEGSEDMYASIDAAAHKIERQIRKAHGAENAKRHKETDLRHMQPEPVAATGGEQ
jgi:putative sigma-54 modulation protein